MGRDKALLPFCGGVLAEAIAREVKAAVGHAAFVGSPALDAVLSSGQRKVIGAPEGLPVAVLLVGETAPLQNVNTPADWAAYARD